MIFAFGHARNVIRSKKLTIKKNIYTTYKIHVLYCVVYSRLGGVGLWPIFHVQGPKSTAKSARLKPAICTETEKPRSSVFARENDDAEVVRN